MASILVSLRPRMHVTLELADGQVALDESTVQRLRAVTDLGSLVAAARALGVPHRTAWKRIRQLEACLGVSMLSRVAKKPVHPPRLPGPTPSLAARHTSKMPAEL